MYFQDVHLKFLRKALDEARKCEPIWPSVSSFALVNALASACVLPGSSGEYPDDKMTGRPSKLGQRVTMMQPTQKAVGIKELVGWGPVPWVEDLLKNADVYTTLVIQIHRKSFLC